jgi:hypothetical protein
LGGKGQTSGVLETGKRWAFALIPALGLVELAAHAVQICSITPAGDWRAARDYVAARAKDEDLIAFAPRWADPLGREYFGASLATTTREARADETRFLRAFEVSIRGAHLEPFAEWRHAGEEHFGSVLVTTWENPAPRIVIDDLVAHLKPPLAQVDILQGGRETGCSFGHGSVQSGPLGYGPAVPSDRFACPSGGSVSVSVVADWEYVGRRCIYAPAPGGAASLRIRFLGVRMGRSLEGHHTLYVEAERGRSGSPVTITFRAGETILGQAVHHDGESWKPFQFDTGALAGTQADLSAEIGAPNGERRMYCFEATTR